MEDELTTVSLSELRPGTLSSAHLFAFIKGRPFLLLRAGDVIDSDFVQKYTDRGVSSFKALVVAAEAQCQ